MIFKVSMLALILSHTTNVFAFDVCDRSGFEKSGDGWIKTIVKANDTIINYIINVEELEREYSQDNLKVDDEIAPSLALDAAENGYYQYFKTVSPPAFLPADLAITSTESYFSICNSKKTYGFSTPLRTFKWVKTKQGQGDPQVSPRMKEFLRKKAIGL